MFTEQAGTGQGMCESLDCLLILLLFQDIPEDDSTRFDSPMSLLEGRRCAKLLEQPEPRSLGDTTWRAPKPDRPPPPKLAASLQARPQITQNDNIPHPVNSRNSPRRTAMLRQGSVDDSLSSTTSGQPLPAMQGNLISPDSEPYQPRTPQDGNLETDAPQNTQHIFSGILTSIS